MRIRNLFRRKRSRDRGPGVTRRDIAFEWHCATRPRSPEFVAMCFPTGYDVNRLFGLLTELHELGGETVPNSWFAGTVTPNANKEPRPIGVGNHVDLVTALTALVDLARRAQHYGVPGAQK
jgi:hypothetical protein